MAIEDAHRSLMMNDEVDAITSVRTVLCRTFLGSGWRDDDWMMMTSASRDVDIRSNVHVIHPCTHDSLLNWHSHCPH
jgi:hypothetical protein